MGRVRRSTAIGATVVALVLAPCSVVGSAAAPIATPKATSLTLKPAKAVAGEKVKVKGSVPAGTARPVTLQRKTGSGWSKVAADKTSKKGAFTFSLTAPAAGSTYRVLAKKTTAAGRTWAKAVTPTRALGILQQTAALSLAGSAQTGDAVAATATFAPARAGRTVALERRIGGTWVTEMLSTQEAQGRATFWLDAASGVHTYRATARPWKGAGAVSSAERTITVSDPPVVDQTPPDPVSFLEITASTATTLSLAWSNPGDADYAGAMIRRAVGSTPPSTPTGGTLVVDRLAPGESHQDTGLSPGTTYSYAVFAHDAVPNYAAAATVTGATDSGPDTTPPGPVTGLSIVGTAQTSLTLNWTNPGDADYAGAMIRRAAGSTPPSSPTSGTLVTDKLAPGDSHQDTGLSPGTTYSYAVFAHDAVPNYAAAATVTGTTGTAPDTTPPGPVTGLTVGSATSGSLTLAWTNPGDADYTGAMIRRATGPTPPGSPTSGTLVTDKLKPGTSHVDSGLSPATTYSYAVFAHDAVPNYASAATGQGTTTAAGTGSWAQTAHDPGHTGWASEESTITPGNAGGVGEEWALTGNGHPAIFDGVLYVSSTEPIAAQGRLGAYALDTGVLLWQIDTGDCSGPLSVNASLVVVGCAEPVAYQRTGAHAVVWDVTDTDPGAGMQYFQLTSDRLVAWTNTKLAVYRLSDAQRVWQQLLPAGAGSIHDAVVSGTTVVVAYDDRLRGLSLTNGSQTWVDTTVRSSALVAAGGWVYTNDDQGVKRYAVADGAPGWSVRENGDIYRIAAADGDTVYVWEAVFDFGPPSPSILHALRQSDGSQRWQAAVPSRIGSVAIAGDVVWYTSTGIYSQEHASDLVALDRATGSGLRSLHFEDNMYGWTDVAFGGGKVVVNQGGSFGDPVPRALRVFGLAGPVPAVSTAALPLGTTGTAYSATLRSVPAGATWTIRSGALPAGLTLAANGVISGTPTAAALSRVTVRATSANGRYAERTFPLQVLGTTAPGAWSMAGRDASRNPFVAGSADFGLETAPTFAFRWKTAPPGAAVAGGDSDTVYADGRIYAVQWDGTLSAWSSTGGAANRTPEWSVTPPAGGSPHYVGQPTLAGDRLLVRDANGYVHGIRATDGAHLWVTTTQVTWAAGLESMLVSGTTFFTTGAGDAIVAFSTVDGTPRWGGASTGVSGTYYPAATDGTRIYAQRDCELYAFRVSDGTTAWHTPYVQGETGNCGMIYGDTGPPVVADGKVYAANSSGRLIADAATGSPLLRFRAPGNAAGTSVVAGGLWIFSAGDTTQAVDTVTGDLAWRVPDNGDLVRLSVVGDLVIGLSTFSMVGLSRLDGEKVWDAGSIGSGWMLPTPVVGGNRIFVLSQEGVRAYGPLE